MTVEKAFVLCRHEHLGSGALIGKLIYEVMPIQPLMIFGGARQLYEADLMYTVETRVTLENPRCVVVAVLSPFEAAPHSQPSRDGEPLSTSADVAFLLGYLQGRLPKSHVFVIHDAAASGFWVDPEIRSISPGDPRWRVALARGVAEIGVDVDLGKITDLDG